MDLVLKAEEDCVRFGLVVVRNPDRTINRVFKVPQKEVDRVNDSGSGWPDGVTQREWESGLARMSGGCLEVGAVIKNDDGSLQIKYGEEITETSFKESHLLLQRDEWTGQVPEITTDAFVVDVKAAARDPVVIRQDSIVVSAGVLEKS